MKRFILIISLILLTIKLYPDDLTINKLIETNWISEAPYGLSIQFLNNNKCIVKDPVPQVMQEFEATYKLENGKVSIFYDQYSDEKVLLNGVYKKGDLTNSFEYYIEFDNNLKIFNSNTIINAGINGNVNDIPVITMGNVIGILEYNMKLREQPNINSNIIEYGILDENADELNIVKKIKYIPKEYHINIILKTKNKYKVKEWHNYWYYISINDVSGDNLIKGWMFSESIKIKQ